MLVGATGEFENEGGVEHGERRAHGGAEQRSGGSCAGEVRAAAEGAQRCQKPHAGFEMLELRALKCRVPASHHYDQAAHKHAESDQSQREGHEDDPRQEWGTPTTSVRRSDHYVLAHPGDQVSMLSSEIQTAPLTAPSSELCRPSSASGELPVDIRKEHVGASLPAGVLPDVISGADARASKAGGIELAG